jgi:5-methylthioadenosine/S-adenosylhomocysteine deaminase
VKLWTADHVFVDRRFQAGAGVLVDDAGRIARVGAATELAAAAPDAELRHLAGHALVPGCVNTHTHTFQVLLRGNGDNAANFRDWVDAHLYPLVERLDERLLDAAATLAYAEMALAGTTAVGEFFYVHNGASRPRDDPNAHAVGVIKAARRVGLRTTLLRTMYDLGSRPGQARFRESVDTAVAATRELASRFVGDPFVNVLPAPHSLHGASERMIRAGAELAEELDGRFHIHLAEQRGDIAYAVKQYNAPPLEALDAMGTLSDRTVLVHGIWLNDAERRLLGERGGGLAYNPLTNMALGDGVAPIPDLLRQGVTISLGTDANNRLNLFDEMRAVEYLQRAIHLEMGIVPGVVQTSRSTALPLFEMGTVNGARNLGIEAGELRAGLWADMVAIDLGDPSLWPAAFTGGDDLLNAVVYSMVAQTAVRHVFVAGEPIVEDGRLSNLSLVELRAELAEALAAVR